MSTATTSGTAGIDGGTAGAASAVLIRAAMKTIGATCFPWPVPGISSLIFNSPDYTPLLAGQWKPTGSRRCRGNAVVSDRPAVGVDLKAGGTAFRGNHR